MFVLCTAYKGFGNGHYPVFGTSITVACAASFVCTAFCMAFIKAGISWKGQTDMLRGILDASTSTLAAICLTADFFFLFVQGTEDEEVIIVAGLSNQLFNTGVHWSHGLQFISLLAFHVFILGMYCFGVNQPLKENIEEIAGKDNDKTSRPGWTEFFESIAIVFLWLQYYREWTLSNICSKRPCRTKDIERMEDLDLEFFNFTWASILIVFVVKMCTIRIQDKMKHDNRLVFFLLYVFFKVSVVSGLIVIYFVVIINDEIALLQPFTLFVICFLCVRTYLQCYNARKDTTPKTVVSSPKPTTKFSSRSRDFLKFGSDIQVGATQKKKTLDQFLSRIKNGESKQKDA